VQAWGTSGHQVVAGLAQSLLSNKANQAVSTILNGETLKSIAMWADNVKRSAGYEWSGALHYVDTDDRICAYSYAKDCFDPATGETGVCVINAISNFTQQLRHQYSPARRFSSILNLTRDLPADEALKFVVHFLGDVHQPLHVGFRSDQGGNALKVTLLDYSTNLHSVWDSGLIFNLLKESYGDSQDAWESDLLSRVSVNGQWHEMAQKWKNCPDGSLACTAPYAEESVSYACANAYECKVGATAPCAEQAVHTGDVLGASYQAQGSPVVSLRIAAGGVRLAAILEDIFNPSS